MVFGDNVRARMAARALPRTPTQRGRRRERRRGEEGRRRDHTPHTPPSRSPHSNTATQQHKEKGDSTTRGNVMQKEDRTMRNAGSNPKTGNTMKRTGTTQDKGTTQQHHHSRHSIGPQSKQQGGRQHTDGDAAIRRGVSNTVALPSLCHPPSAMPPHHPRRPHPPPRRGGST